MSFGNWTEAADGDRDSLPNTGYQFTWLSTQKDFIATEREWETWGGWFIIDLASLDLILYTLLESKCVTLKLSRICFSTLWMIPILTVFCGHREIIDCIVNAVRHSCACDCGSASFPNCALKFSVNIICFWVFFYQTFDYSLLLHLLSNFHRCHLAVRQLAYTEVWLMCGGGPYEVTMVEWLQSAVLVMRNSSSGL